MTRIELTEAETDMLREIIQKHLAELSHEIAFSHGNDVRKFLEKRRDFLEDFAQRLEKQSTSGDESGPSREQFSPDPAC